MADRLDSYHNHEFPFRWTCPACGHEQDESVHPTEGPYCTLSCGRCYKVSEDRDLDAASLDAWESARRLAEERDPEDARYKPPVEVPREHLPGREQPMPLAEAPRGFVEVYESDLVPFGHKFQFDAVYQMAKRALDDEGRTPEASAAA